MYKILLILEDNGKKCYINMTKRKFKERLKEHCNDVKHPKPSMALSRFYLNSYNCHIDFETAKVILASNASCKNLENL